MRDTMTAGALRVIRGASLRASQRGSAVVDTIDLLTALVAENESRAAVLMAEHGMSPDKFFHHLGLVQDCLGSDDESEIDLEVSITDQLPHSDELKSVIQDATQHARALDRSLHTGTEHLLFALLEPKLEASSVLAQAGLEVSNLRDRLSEMAQSDASPIPLPSEVAPLELVDPAEIVDLARVLDASANRAQEGLRVVEDFIRFVLGDPSLTRRIKDVRHRLGVAIRGLDSHMLISSRDTIGDVGAHVMTAGGKTRANQHELLTANFKRAAEALRSLEEYTKLVDVWLSGRFEVLRYDTYVLEKMTIEAMRSLRALGESRLYLLVGGLPTLGDLTWIVGEALAGGVDAIQLREKGVPDREVLSRAREVRILTAKSGARFIMNDRADLARLAGADGVHLGQDDVQLRDARRVVGPMAILGVSTHSRGEIDKAIVEGAGYLGVGPVFPSETKSFDLFAGLELVRQAAQTTTLPWFAIGGIDERNIGQVLEAGAVRVAVGGAIVRAERPRHAAKLLRDSLDRGETPGS